MKKVFLTLVLMVSLVLFSSCNKGKITEYENTIEQLNSKIALIQEENDNLKKEIEAYNQTDQYFYQSGADEFLKENYLEALRCMGKLKVKYPTSPLLVYANKIIEDAKTQIDKLPSSVNTAFKSTFIYIPGIGDIPQKPRNYGEHTELITGSATLKSGEVIRGIQEKE